VPHNNAIHIIEGANVSLQPPNIDAIPSIDKETDSVQEPLLLKKIPI
jgi:hypothetical protein